MSQSAGGPPSGTLLAFDYGARRIGVAVGEQEPQTAAALTTVDARDGAPRWDQLDPLVAEWQPVALVIGIPHHSDGTESALAAPARQFAGELGRRYGLPVFSVDESLTSRAADAELREQRKSGMLRRRVRRDDSDRIAARLILESWLVQHTGKD